jgi:hypothetical protein
MVLKLHTSDKLVNPFWIGGGLGTTVIGKDLLNHKGHKGTQRKSTANLTLIALIQPIFTDLFWKSFALLQISLTLRALAVLLRISREYRVSYIVGVLRLLLIPASRGLGVAQDDMALYFFAIQEHFCASLPRSLNDKERRGRPGAPYQC